MYVPWDEAGCLCPVGDLFNYAAPEGESFNAVDVLSFPSHASLNDELELLEEQRDSQWALTDGGFEENASAYCFYARENYRKGEQVFYIFLVSFIYFVLIWKEELMQNTINRRLTFYLWSLISI